MRIVRLTAAGMIVAMAAAAMGQTQPAPERADFSEPRGAMRAFLRAKEEPAMRAALLVLPENQAAVDEFLGVMVATTELQKAAEAKYGTGAAKYFSANTAAQIDARMKTIDAAPVQVTGDHATVSLPADEETRQLASVVKLKRVEGDWKIDAASLFGITGGKPGDTERRLEIAKTLRTVTRGMIKDLPKYPSASEAYQEYWNRSKEAMVRLRGPATTRP